MRQPTVSDVETSLKEGLEERFPGQTKLLSVVKLNGKGDSKHYELQCSYRVEFIKDKDGTALYNGGTLKTHISQYKYTWIKKQTPGRNITKGDIFENKGWFSFQKTENGWKPSMF